MARSRGLFWLVIAVVSGAASGCGARTGAITDSSNENGGGGASGVGGVVGTGGENGGAAGSRGGAGGSARHAGAGGHRGDGGYRGDGGSAGYTGSGGDRGHAGGVSGGYAGYVDGGVSRGCGPGGLVAYYPFDTDTADHAGTHDAVATATTQVPGVLGQARYFGTYSVIRVGGTGLLSGARSLCAWVMPAQATGLGQPVFAAGSVGAGDFFSVQSSTPSGDCAVAGVEGQPFIDHWGTACYTSDGPAQPDFTWSLVCYLYDGVGTLGLSLDSEIHPVAGALYDYDFSTLTIGSSAIGGTTTQASFAGSVDEVTIWDHALTQAELAALWNDGRGCVAR